MRSLAVAVTAVVALAGSSSAFCPARLGLNSHHARAGALQANGNVFDPQEGGKDQVYGSAARAAARAARRSGAPGQAPPQAPAPQAPPAPPARGPAARAARRRAAQEQAPPPQAPAPAAQAPAAEAPAEALAEAPPQAPPDYAGAAQGSAPESGAPVAAAAAPDSGAPPGAAAAAAAGAKMAGIHASKCQMSDGVAAALSEFCASRYARAAAEYCNASPTTYGNIWGMFGSVVLKPEGDVLVVRLNRNFEQRSKQLLDQLARHLHARIPELRQLQYEKTSPPSTETTMLAAVRAKLVV